MAVPLQVNTPVKKLDGKNAGGLGRVVEVIGSGDKQKIRVLLDGKKKPENLQSASNYEAVVVEDAASLLLPPLTQQSPLPSPRPVSSSSSSPSSRPPTPPKENLVLPPLSTTPDAAATETQQPLTPLTRRLIDSFSAAASSASKVFFGGGGGKKKGEPEAEEAEEAKEDKLTAKETKKAEKEAAKLREKSENPNPAAKLKVKEEAKEQKLTPSKKKAGDDAALRGGGASSVQPPRLHLPGTSYTALPLVTSSGRPLMDYNWKKREKAIGHAAHCPWVAGDESNWYEDETRCYPHEFSPTSLRQFPVVITIDEEEEGASRESRHRKVIEFDGKTYTEAEWEAQMKEWLVKYPNLKQKDKSSRWESEAFRATQCSSAAIIDACWDACKSADLWVPVDLKSHGKAWNLLQDFRIDMYGSVVTHKSIAQKDALTNFDVDHIFPFCRGGRSLPANFAAVQCAANRHVKSDSMLQMLDPINMQAGLMPEQLIAMLRVVIKAAGKERNTAAGWIQDIKTWITTPPRNKDGFSDFQKDVARSLDGEVLVKYFSDRAERSNKNKLLRIFGGGGCTTPAQQQQQQQQDWTRQVPAFQEYVVTVRRVVKTKTLEVVGTRTTPIMKEDPRFKALKLKYAGKPSYAWVKKCVNEEETQQLVAELESLAADLGFKCVLEVI